MPILLAAILMPTKPQVKTQDPQGALYRAIALCDRKAVQKAVSEGASLRLSAKGYTEPPLFYALQWRGMFKTLCRMGAPTGDTDRYGRTLLHYLVSDRETLRRTASEMDKPSPDVFQAYTAGSQGLNGYRMPWEERKKLAESLLEHGLKIEARDRLGRTALHYAAQSEWRGVQFLLNLGSERPSGKLRGLSAWAQVNARDDFGGTPLILLAEKGEAGNVTRDVILAGMLLESGADSAIRDRQGKNAEDWAVVRGKNVLVALLKERRENPSGP